MAIHRYSLDADLPTACWGSVLALGNFDGVHLGHQALVAEAARQARGLQTAAIAVTFDPHPWQVLRPSSFQPLLTTIDDRAALLQSYGADHVLVLQTTPALLGLEARQFFDSIIRSRLQALALVEGYNFAFGHNRTGTIDVLQQLCREAALPLTLVPPLEIAGLPVSSSRVRKEILAGAMANVRALLARPYRIAGVVGSGEGRGRTLGIPTANLVDIPTLVPGDGVYAACALHAGSTWAAAVHVGPNPTFGEAARKVEAHLLDFNGDLYGQTLALDFLEKIRATRRFANVDDLMARIQDDVDATRRLCGNIQSRS